jgi:hypothetical protein
LEGSKPLLSGCETQSCDRKSICGRSKASPTDFFPRASRLASAEKEKSGVFSYPHNDPGITCFLRERLRRNEGRKRRKKAEAV